MFEITSTWMSGNALFDQQVHVWYVYICLSRYTPSLAFLSNTFTLTLIPTPSPPLKLEIYLCVKARLRESNLDKFLQIVNLVWSGSSFAAVGLWTLLCRHWHELAKKLGLLVACLPIQCDQNRSLFYLNASFLELNLMLIFLTLIYFWRFAYIYQTFYGFDRDSSTSLRLLRNS